MSVLAVYNQTCGDQLHEDWARGQKDLTKSQTCQLLLIGEPGFHPSPQARTLVSVATLDA